MQPDSTKRDASRRGNLWRRWHERRPLLRFLIKTTILLVVLVLVMFPKPQMIPVWISRLRNMESVLDPQHPGLADLEWRVRFLLPPDKPAASAVLPIVEQLVDERIPYKWDWDTWGVVDWLPTVDEALTMGAEDCDGRAVVAASLLRRLGYQANLVSDVLHVWVDTPAGATMRPTSTEQTLVSAAGGTKLTITPGLVRNLGRGMSYGVGAFPLGREAILLATIALLTMQPRSSFWRRVAGCAILWIALLTIRESGINAAMSGGGATYEVWIGWTLALIGWLILAIRAGGAPRHCAPALAE